MTIEKWEDIKEDFQGATLMLGNGFSIGIDANFEYDSLWEKAKEQPPCGETRETLTKELCFLAEELSTGTNFELLLRQLYTAKVVNENLELGNVHIIECNYAKLRNALIDTITEIHCAHSEVECELNKRIGFLKQFSTVFSLSYDLLIYWIINLNNRNEDNAKNTQENYIAQKTLKDCWDNDGFRYDDWEKYRIPYPKEKNRTLVFFPHGALHLLQTENGVVEKVQRTEGIGLLDYIKEVWLNDSDKKHPLFVAEGNHNEKLRAIQNNAYLNTVYQQILPSSIKDVKLVIFGWAMSEFDEHLINKIISSEPSEIAIGFYHQIEEEDKEEQVATIKKAIKKEKDKRQREKRGNFKVPLRFFEINENFFE